MSSTIREVAGDPAGAVKAGTANAAAATADKATATASADKATGTATAEHLVHPAREQIKLEAVLHALSDPMRLRIVEGLASGEARTCGSFDLPVVKSTCTHHFKVLREAGVIHQQLEGTTRLNSLRREDLEARFPGLIEAILRAGNVA